MVDGKPNQLYTQGLLKEITWREITKLFKENGVSIGESLTQNNVLLLDLRPSVDNKIHGNGVELRNTTDGITIEIHQVAEAATESLNLQVFLLQYANLNIESGSFHSIAFSDKFTLSISSEEWGFYPRH